MRRGAPKRIRSTSACSSMSSGRPPSRVTVTMLPGRGLRRAREEDRRWIAHLLESRLRHGEEAELVHRPEAVLGGAHDAVTAAGLALEVQHGVDQVLEHPRARDRAFLGDVADDDDGGARWSWRSARAPPCIRAAARRRPRLAVDGHGLHASGSSLRPAVPPAAPQSERVSACRSVSASDFECCGAAMPRRRARRPTWATDSSPLA